MSLGDQIVLHSYHPNERIDLTRYGQGAKFISERYTPETADDILQYIGKDCKQNSAICYNVMSV